MSPTAEQRDLRDAVRDLIGKAEAGGTQGTAARAAGTAWRRLCDEVGVAGLAIPSQYGGAGAGLAEVCVVMAELGRNLTPAPMLGSAVLAARAVLGCGDPAACERLLPAIADGSAVAALAWTTPAGRWDAGEAACTARPAGQGPGGQGPGGQGLGGTAWELAGEAHYVLDATAADVLLVVARTPDDGTGLFEVDPRGDGVTRRGVAAMDASRDLAVVGLAGARGRRVGGDAAGALALARDWACVALAAELAGAAERALELTVEYLLARVQFGQAIGGFQALQHRAADLHVLVESARSLARAVAAEVVAAQQAGDLAPRAAAAKVYCSEALTQVAGQMIQLHGAIGITWEHRAHRYFKRAHGGRYLLGHPDRHLAVIAAGLIDGPAAGDS
jgi:alkylation response protein AidB-like acyl-CoA dehydrogenase